MASNGPRAWDLEADVVVVGSGVAGLSAAATAAVDGASVLLLERSDRLGGTTALSGGVAWVPNNDHMRELELPDSREQALIYLRRLALDRGDPALLEAFVDAAPEAARFLEEHTPLRFIAAGRGDSSGGVMPFPDYQSALPGAAANGRSLDPVNFDPSRLGALADAVREPMPYSISWSGTSLATDDGQWAGGMALVGALLAGCVKLGVEIERSVRARHLERDEGGAVIGLVAERDGAELRIGARRGLVLAAGGFEWDRALRERWLRGPVDVVLSPEGLNEGDALRMGMEAGAAIGNIGEAWWTTALRIPEEAPTPQHQYRFCARARSLPGSILVNRRGLRFVNEAVNYHDMARAFHQFDPGAYDYPNRPSWLLFGEAYRRRFGILNVAADAPDPPWLHPHRNLDEVAAACGIDAANLRQTVERFDAGAAQGVDPDFERGQAPYDLATGDASQEGVARTLGPIGNPPYYALEVQIATLGTSSGLQTNASAQVIDVWGEPVPGLYAAGNTIASPTATAYGGAGGTIGPAMTFGYLAGRSAASQAAR